MVYQSVLSFLQQFNHVLPEFPQIQAVCLARGARLESRPRGFYDQSSDRGFTLSDSESHKLSKVLKTYFPTRCVPGTPEAREAVRVLTDIWRSRPEPRIIPDPCNGRRSKLKRQGKGRTKTISTNNQPKLANRNHCSLHLTHPIQRNSHISSTIKTRPEMLSDS